VGEYDRDDPNPDAMAIARRIALALSGLLVALDSVPRLGAQQTPARSEFIIRKGNDTVAVEVFSRDAGTLTSEIYQSTGVRTQFTYTFKPDNTPVHVDMMRQGAQGQPSNVSISFGDTLVTASGTVGGESGDAAISIRGRATPFLVASFALSEQIVRSAHLELGKSATFTAMRLGAGDTTTLTVTRIHADSALLSMPGLQVKVCLSPKGDVVGGLHLTQGWTVERKQPR
jgi:hypothetical protein